MPGDEKLQTLPHNSGFEMHTINNGQVIMK